MEQIEYDYIVDSANREQIDEFVEIMLEVALCRSPTMKIGREAEYPTALVQQRFEQITSAHIGKVLDGIRENTTRVWNTRAYLLAALFNAPFTTWLTSLLLRRRICIFANSSIYPKINQERNDLA